MIAISVDKPLRSLGYSKITGLSAAKTLGNIPNGTILVKMMTEAQAIRWRDDGVTVTATDGMQLAVNTYLDFIGDISKLTVIELAASATLHVTFYGY